jgi:hypothetical protein
MPRGIERGLKYAGGGRIASFRGGAAAGLPANTILSVFLGRDSGNYSSRFPGRIAGHDCGNYVSYFPGRFAGSFSGQFVGRESGRFARHQSGHFVRHENGQFAGH